MSECWYQQYLLLLNMANLNMHLHILHTNLNNAVVSVTMNVISFFLLAKGNGL